MVKSKSSLASGWAFFSRSMISLDPAFFLGFEFDFVFVSIAILVLSRKYVSRRSGLKGGIRKMDLNELQRMTMPKLRDLAKESTELQGESWHG